MKKQIIFTLSLLLAQSVCINLNAEAKLNNDSELDFSRRLLAMAEMEKLKLAKVPVDKLKLDQVKLEDKEVLLKRTIEQLFDENNSDKFAVHVDFLVPLFEKHKLPKDNKVDKNKIEQYKELAKFLKKNRDCNSIVRFLCVILPELKKKAPEKITSQVIKIVDEKGPSNIYNTVKGKLG